MGQDNDDDDDDRGKRGGVNRITDVCPDGLVENRVILCKYRQQFLSVLPNAN
jgi:hypothetical protein